MAGTLDKLFFDIAENFKMASNKVFSKLFKQKEF